MAGEDVRSKSGMLGEDMGKRTHGVGANVTTRGVFVDEDMVYPVCVVFHLKMNGKGSWDG